MKGLFGDVAARMVATAARRATEPAPNMPSHGRGTLISSDGQLNGARQTCLCLPVELLNAREGNF